MGRETVKHTQRITRQNTDNPLMAGANERLQPSKHLSIPARKLFREIVRSLPVDWFHSADQTVLDRYCIRATKVLEWERVLAEEGDVYADKAKVLRQHPYVSMTERADSYLLTAATKLRLTPKSRTGATISKASAAAQVADNIKKVGARKAGLMYIPTTKKQA